MDLGTLIGLGSAAFCIMALGMQWSVGPFYDVPSIGIVFGGVIAAALITYSPAAVLGSWRVLLLAFIYKAENPLDLIKRMVEFAEIARRDGILALENVTDTIQDPFLVKGIQLAVDGTDPELIEQIMNTEIENIDTRHTNARKTLEVIKNNAPGYGSLGTVIGLIQMLKGGVEDANKLTAGMAVALITTFYGSCIANILGPLCDKLGNRHAEEMQLKEIILKGVMSIQSGDNPRIVEQKLKIFLPPNQRNFGKEE